MDDFTKSIAAIREDTEHGSRWLAHQAIVLLRDVASQPAQDPVAHLEQLRQLGKELAEARPAMAALAGAVRRILAATGGAQGMARVAEQLLEAFEHAVPAMIAALRPLVQGTVLTHSLSGTVLEVLRACVPPINHFIVLEGRPLYEGRTTALQLRAQTSAHVTLITDAQAEIVIPQCQAVVVGADSLLADGSVLNKAGTALLARAAQGHAIPFYVLAETLKISPRSWSNEPDLLEEHPAQEVWPDLVADIHVHNYYFDRTPASLITGILSEQGWLSATEIAHQAAML
jgi:translation initiation factor 2B subunit (eIF-2B alpha/beta/delta family)